jgi:hypothetical protein
VEVFDKPDLGVIKDRPIGSGLVDLAPLICEACLTDDGVPVGWPITIQLYSPTELGIAASEPSAGTVTVNISIEVNDHDG